MKNAPTMPILANKWPLAAEALNRLADSKEFVLDVETTGLDWRTDRIIGYVLTFGPTPQDTYYVPVRHGMKADAGNLPDLRGDAHIQKRMQHQFEEQLVDIFNKTPGQKMVGHHIMFDLMMLFGEGIRFFGKIEDTEVNDALIDEYAASHSLEASCIRMGTKPKKGEELYRHLAKLFGGNPDRRSQMGNFWRLRGDDPVGFDYAAGDGVSNWALVHRQREVLAEEEMESMRGLESDITRVIYRMTMRGTKVDEKRLAQVMQQVDENREQALKALPKDFDPGKPSQVRAFLEKAGHTDWPMTAPTGRFPKGNPSFKDEWLRTHQPGRDILAVRKLTHLKNSFLTPLVDRHIFKGRVHPTFHQMANDDFGTVTGRFSCSNPNLQQVHKRNKELGMLFRSVFVPDSGMEWYDADLSQCEPRLLAHYGEVKVLIDGYLADPPVDAHTAVATAANIDRESGKRLNQTLITGGGRNRVIEMLGEGGSAIYNAYFEAMPEVKQLQKTASSVMRRRGYVTSLLGRRARLQSLDKDYLAINRLLQCGNADVIKKAMVDIDRVFEEDGDQRHMLNTVHDALSMQAPKSKGKTRKDDPVIMEALRLMTNFGPDPAKHEVFLEVPMVVEYGVGVNWAEATYTKDKRVFG